MIALATQTGLQFGNGDELNRFELLLHHADREHELQACLGRALNTWDNAPKWLLQLSDLLESRKAARQV